MTRQPTSQGANGADVIGVPVRGADASIPRGHDSTDPADRLDVMDGRIGEDACAQVAGSGDRFIIGRLDGDRNLIPQSIVGRDGRWADLVQIEARHRHRTEEMLARIADVDADFLAGDPAHDLIEGVPNRDGAAIARIGRGALTGTDPLHARRKGKEVVEVTGDTGPAEMVVDPVHDFA